MSRPLAGLRVLDLTRLLPGPCCTFLLHQLGAEIVKVEDTGSGDLLRRMPPLVDGVGATFAYLHRGKQSVALDLKNPAGQAVAQQLAARCDVVLEGFRPGVSSRLGIDFTALVPRNPRLVYCSISGYGQEGPLRVLPGHDLTYAAMVGLLDALSPGEPRVPGVQLVDAAGALLAAIHILAALWNREAGPQYLDISLADGARALMPGALAEALAPPTHGPSLLDALRGSVRNDLYRCADGRWLALSPLEDPFWQRLCALLQEQRAIDADRPVTSDRLHEVFGRRTCEEWLALLSAADIPCAPVNSVREAIERGAGEPTEEPDSTGPSELDATPERVPAWGEHTVPWLEALGYSPQRIAQLAEQRVIQSVASPDDERSST